MAVKASTSITVYDQTDVLKVTTFYQRLSSTANPPSAPTTTTTAATVSGWSTTMPAYGSSYRCYKVERSERGDGSCVWGTVTEDQNWAGANSANSTATDASATANAAKDAVDNISVGGRNFILDSAGPIVSAASASESTYIANRTLSTYGASQTKDTSQVLVFSFDWTVTGNSVAGAYVYPQLRGSSISENVDSTIIQTVGTGDSVSGHYEHRFKPTSAQATTTNENVRIRLRYGSDGAVLTVSNWKLEKGNKATDWTPAPEDVNGAISSLIGRNLAADTATEKVFGTSNTSNTYYMPNPAYRLTSYGISQLVDQKVPHFAISFDWSATGCTSEHSLYLNFNTTASSYPADSTNFIFESGNTVSVGDSSGHAFLIVSPVDSARRNDSKLLLNTRVAGNGGANESITISNFMLAAGDSEHGWTMAPEDTASLTSVAAAQATADTALARPGMFKIDRAQISATVAQWITYGTYGTANTWTTGSNYDNSKIRVGDTAYVTGTITDGDGGTATIIGRVTAVNGTNGSTSITLYSTQLIFGGDAIDSIADRVTQAETSITSTNEQIALMATKTELVDAIDDAAYTRTDYSKQLINTTDAAELPLLGLTVYGESVQDGTPTPDSPVEIESVDNADLVMFDRTAGRITIDQSNTVTERFINNVGDSSVDHGWCHSDYISVVPGSFMMFEVDTTYGPAARHAFYDSSKSTVKCIESGSFGPVKVPDNAAYMRVSFRADSTNVVLLESNDSTHLFAPSTAPSQDRFVATKTVTNVGSCLFYSNPIGGSFEAGTYITASGGFGYTSGWQLTDFIEIPEGAVAIQFEVDTTAGNSAKHAFCNSSKTITDLVASGPYGPAKIPDGSKYVRFSMRDTSVSYRLTFGWIPVKPLRSLPDGTCDTLIINADGSGTITRRVGCLDLSTVDSWGRSNTNIYSYVLPGAIVESGNVDYFMTSHFSKTTVANASMPDLSLKVTYNSSADPTSQVVRIRNAAYTDVPSFTAWLSSLDTPIVLYKIIPVTETIPAIDMPTTHSDGVVYVSADVIPEIDASWWTTIGYNAGKALSVAQANINVNADEIDMRVEKDGVISAINQSAEQVTIDAERVNIAGATIFTSGRLSETSLNAAYDASGAAATVQTNLDNLQVGGRNLLLGTATQIKPGANAVRNYPLSAWAKDNVVSADEITLSFDAKADTTPTYMDCYWRSGSTSHNNTSSFYPSVYLTTSFQHFEITDTSKKDLSTIDYMYFRTNGSVHGGSSSGKAATVKNVKLERGNKATGWTPAPEDVDASISTVSTEANGAAAREQTIYKSVAANASAPGAQTTWCSNTNGAQNVWTTVRPEYNQDYPALYTALQRQTVAQAANSGTSCSCTTPALDKTTTVIDGGNIITNSIHADRILTDEIQQIGPTNGKHMSLTANGVSIMADQNTELAKFTASSMTIGNFELQSVVEEIGVAAQTERDVVTMALDGVRQAGGTPSSQGHMVLPPLLIFDCDVKADSISLESPLSIENGGTNATTAAAALENLGALPTAGGYMTGTLNMKAGNIADNVTVTEDKAGRIIAWRDSTNAIIGYIQPYFRTTGNQFMQMTCRRNISGTDKNNNLSIGIGPDGTEYVSVSNAKAWRTGISAAKAGVTKSSASSQISMLSGFSFNSIYTTIGAECVLTINLTVKVTTAITSGYTAIVGQLTSGLWPYGGPFNLQVTYHGTDYAWVTTDGYVKFEPHRAVSKNELVNMTGTYVLNI